MPSKLEQKVDGARSRASSKNEPGTAFWAWTIAPVYDEGRDAQQGTSSIQDGERLARWLYKNEVSLYIHGHKHQNIVAKISRPTGNDGSYNIPKENEVVWNTFALAGLGSSGSRELGSTENQIGLISIEKNEIKITWIAIIKSELESKVISTVSVPVQPEG